MDRVLAHEPVKAASPKQVGGAELTPVSGTTQPPRGLSGALRRRAYRIPEHWPRHWALLLVADRVDVVESAVVDTVRRRPILTALAVLGGGAAAWRIIRRWR